MPTPAVGGTVGTEHPVPSRPGYCNCTERCTHAILLCYVLNECVTVNVNFNVLHTLICSDRAHIINILPNLWMLDGQLITGERTCDVKVIETRL